MNLPVSSLNLEIYGPKDLIALRTRVDDALGLDLDQLDLNKELLAQFKMARIALQDAQTDVLIAANHKTGMINACSALLKQLADSQVSLYSATRLQRLEATLTELLLEMDPAMQKVFLKRYREALSG